MKFVCLGFFDEAAFAQIPQADEQRIMEESPAVTMRITTFEIRPANEEMNRLAAERGAAVASEV